MKEFTNHHAAQYKLVSDDMRFYADQRFKIATVYLVTSGLLVNVAKDHASMTLAVIGILISYLCFCWEAATTRWWGSLIERAKALEALALDNEQMIEVYRTYTNQNPLRGVQKLAYIRPTNAIACLYFIGVTAWALYFVHSVGCWW